MALFQPNQCHLIFRQKPMFFAQCPAPRAPFRHTHWHSLVLFGPLRHPRSSSLGPRPRPSSLRPSSSVRLCLIRGRGRVRGGRTRSRRGVVCKLRDYAPSCPLNPIKTRSKPDHQRSSIGLQPVCITVRFGLAVRSKGPQPIRKPSTAYGPLYGRVYVHHMISVAQLFAYLLANCEQTRRGHGSQGVPL